MGQTMKQHSDPTIGQTVKHVRLLSDRNIGKTVKCACRSAFRSKYEANRKQIRAKYLLKSAKNRDVSTNYSSKQIRSNIEAGADMYQCGNETTELKCNMNMLPTEVKASLKKAFIALHDNIAQILLLTGLIIAA